MQDQATVRRHGVVFLSGYGLKIRVDRGHLVVHDGIADQRRNQRFARVGSGLKRLVVLGQAGYVTLEALRWLREVGAAFLQLDSDGRLVALSASPGTDQPALRRAQALAADTPAGLAITQTLLREKVAGQTAVLAELGGADADGDGLTTVVRKLARAASLEEMLSLEASAALSYWEAWRELPVRYGRRDSERVPDRWLTFGQRHSTLTGSPRLATNPANAILNYLYSLLEAEARLACLAVGLDPGLGVFHRDRKARDSLAMDLMEARRPAVDAYVLALLEQRVLRPNDFVETRRGVCRVLSPLARELASTAPTWRTHIAPVAEEVAAVLAGASGAGETPTPLTEAARTRAWDARRRQPSRTVIGPQLPRTCRVCGGHVPLPGRRHCDACRRDQVREIGGAGRSAAATVLAELRRSDRDPAHGGHAAVRRGAKNAAHQRALREWESRDDEKPSPERFIAEILPLLRNVSSRELMAASGLSEHYCSLIRLGKRVPHPRHWGKLRVAATRGSGDRPRTAQMDGGGVPNASRGEATSRKEQQRSQNDRLESAGSAITHQG